MHIFDFYWNNKSKSLICNKLIDLFPLEGLTALESLLFICVITVYIAIVIRLFKQSVRVIFIIVTILFVESLLDVIQERLCSQNNPEMLTKLFDFDYSQLRLNDRETICTMLAYKSRLSLRNILESLCEFCSAFDFNGFLESIIQQI